MNWFFIALINPIAHATVNHFDKYLLSRYIKGGSVGTLILFSSLFAVVVLPIILIINPGALANTTIWQALALMANGALLVTAIICYLYALSTDEASYVAPFFQLVPVIGFVLGYIFLGEELLRNQLGGMALIVLGGILLSLEFTGGKISLRKKLVLLMLVSSLCYGANAIIFKAIAVEQGFMNSLFWDMAGKVVFGVILFAAVKSYREQFINLIKTNRFTVIGLNSLNEVFALIGEIVIVYAVLIAPVALVQSVGGLQPAFVFIIGIILTLLFPKLGQENLAKRALAQKIAGIGIITVGAYLLTLS